MACAGEVDPDKTRKIVTVQRLVPKEELIARELAKLEHFEAQANIARERLREHGVAA